MAQHNVTLAKQLPQPILFFEFRRNLRRERLEAQRIESGNIGDGVQKAVIQEFRTQVHFFRGDVQQFLECSQQGLADASFHFKTHHRVRTPFPKLALQRFHEIRSAFIIQFEFGVAGDAEDNIFQDFLSCE